MFIQTEATPNPATLKFLPGRDVLVGEPRDFRERESAAISPLAAALFEVPGVEGVFLGSDFISVTKDSAEWSHIKPAILGVIMEHFLSGKPVIDDGTAVVSTGDEFFWRRDLARSRPTGGSPRRTRWRWTAPPSTAPTPAPAGCARRTAAADRAP